MIRQPIISVLGHTDAGKTSLLDTIRSSRVTGEESGGITQMIGATEIPLDTVEEISGDLLEQNSVELDIPGLLFIDTPGHAAFSSLRKRGGSLSDLAILVVDVNEGIQPQTEEAIRILKEDETPLVVALNKVDTLRGWKSEEDSFIRNLKKYNSDQEEQLDEKIYELMAEFDELDIVVDRFDRVDDFRKKVAITPVSAETGEGLPELLMVLSGLAQTYLENELEVSDDMGRASVLEVSKEEGLGTTVDVIHFDGVLEQGDTLVFGDTDGNVKETRIRSILKADEETEIRREKTFQKIDRSEPAAGVRINAPDLEGIYPGSPIRTSDAIQDARSEVQSEIEKVSVETDREGIIVKSNSLGGLEAVRDELENAEIPVKRAEVGEVKKSDVLEAQNNAELMRAVLAFNTGVEELEGWRLERQREIRESKLEETFRPAKIRVLSDHVFRASNPVVCGVKVLEGVLTPRGRLMNQSGEPVGSIKTIQEENEKIESAEKGSEIAVSIADATMGRDVEEGDVLFTDLTGDDYERLQELEELLDATEKQVLDEIVSIKDDKDPHWKL